MNRTAFYLPLFASALALASGAGLAQAPDVPDLGQAEQPPAGDDASEPASIARLNSDFVLPAGEEVDDVVVVGGDVVIEGTVRGDLACVFGDARLGSDARVAGDLAVVWGSLTVDPGAEVEGDMVTIGGSTIAPPGFTAGGDQATLFDFAPGGFLASAGTWVQDGLLWGRPLAPALAWSWLVFLVVALSYLGLNIVFEQPVRACAEVLDSKPLTACLVGLLVLLLLGPVTGLLAVSLVGLPVIPFLYLALFLVGIFGRVSVFRWIGSRIRPEGPAGGVVAATGSLLIGMAAACLAYMVPVLGMVAWTTVGVIGLGAGAATVFAGLRREYPAPAAGGTPIRDLGDASLAGAGAEVPASDVSEYPVARFASRAGAVAVDAFLLSVSALLLGFDSSQAFVLALVYHVVLWAWKATTVGGLVCQLRVVRVDGGALQFSDSLVRGLATIVSVVVVGLGWLWILWDPRRQAWHDKISGTYVVTVPRHPPLP